MIQYTDERGAWKYRVLRSLPKKETIPWLRKN
jgi:hypothetical protein